MRRLFAVCLLLLTPHAQKHDCALGQTDAPNPDGYCEYGYSIPGVITLGTWYLPPPRHFTTRATYQADGVLEWTAHMKGYDGSEDYIALMPASASGYKAFIRAPGGAYLPVRVVDTVNRYDYYFHVIYTHSGVELSYKLARQFGALEPPYLYGLEVCITDAAPEQSCADPPIDYEQWFKTIVHFEG